MRVFVLDECGRILLVRHSYVPGWHLPGGGVGKKESDLEAVKRELNEEAALECLSEPERILGEYRSFAEFKNDTVVVYKVESWRALAEFRPSIEILDCKFFEVSSPPAMTSPATLRRIREYLGQSPISSEW